MAVFRRQKGNCKDARGAVVLGLKIYFLVFRNFEIRNGRNIHTSVLGRKGLDSIVHIVLIIMSA